LLVSTLILIGIILIGALIIYVVDRWRKRSEPSRLSANEQLANFREMYEEGEISHKEFERIREKLAPLVRQELNAATRAGETEEGGSDKGGGQPPPVPADGQKSPPP
jgi:hypothetical protein